LYSFAARASVGASPVANAAALAAPLAIAPLRSMPAPKCLLIFALLE
jgi:hypothetical protein